MAVYFMHQPHDGHLKIGSGGIPKKRVSDQQVGNPHKLVLLGSIPGGKPEERETQKFFDRFRLPGRREWFRAEPEMMAMVHRLIRHQGVPRTVGQELTRRNNCRFGLAGLRVGHLHVEDSDFAIHATAWDSRRELRLTLIPSGGRVVRLFDGEPDARVTVSLADLRRTETVYPAGTIRDARAADCLMLAGWPIPCGCWLEPGEREDGYLWA